MARSAPLPSGSALARTRAALALASVLFAATATAAMVLACAWANAGFAGLAAAVFCVLGCSAAVNSALPMVWADVERLPAPPDGAIAAFFFGAALWLGRAATAPARDFEATVRVAALSALAEGTFRAAPLVFTLALAQGSTFATPPPLPALHAVATGLGLACTVVGLAPELGGLPHDPDRASHQARSTSESVGSALLILSAVSARALALALSRAAGGDLGALAVVAGAFVAAAFARRGVAARVEPIEVCMPGLGEIGFAVLETAALALAPDSYPVAARASTRLATELAIASVECVAIAAALCARSRWRDAVPSSSRLALACASAAFVALQLSAVLLVYWRRAASEWRRQSARAPSAKSRHGQKSSSDLGDVVIANGSIDTNRGHDRRNLAARHMSSTSSNTGGHGEAATLAAEEARPASAQNAAQASPHSPVPKWPQRSLSME